MLSKRIFAVPLITPHGIHSGLMNSIKDDFIELLSQFHFSEPKIPYISNVTGTWIKTEQVKDPSYWWSHLRQTVKFDEGLYNLTSKTNQVFIEIGPGRDISNLMLRYVTPSSTNKLLYCNQPITLKKLDERSFLLKLAGQLWLRGLPVKWEALHSGAVRKKVSLPTYAFEKNIFPMWGSRLMQPITARANTFSKCFFINFHFNFTICYVSIQK